MYHQFHFTAEKIQKRLELLETLAHRRKAKIPPFRFKPLEGPAETPIVDPNFDDSTWQIIQPNSHYATRGLSYMVRSTFTVPAEWSKDAPIAIRFQMGRTRSFSHPEALVYLDGKPWIAVDRHHPEIHLPAAVCDGQTHSLALHGYSGCISSRHRMDEDALFMEDNYVVQIDLPTRELIALTRVALDTLPLLEENNLAHSAILEALDQAFKTLNLQQPTSNAFYDSVPPAIESLRADLVNAGSPLPVKLVMAGHAHIDVAWQWTLGQTRLKSGRTFHNVIRLMEEFPKFKFTQSQPQLYDYVKQDYPELFEMIKQRIAEGRWEPIGGTWVEPDCQITGPESLVRQFLLGRRFYAKHFGADAESPVCFLPDVFGFTWALPQLIKQAGLEYFFTAKLSWSMSNRMPHDSFWWQGIDGTRVLTQFGTTTWRGNPQRTHYNCDASPMELLGTWKFYQEKHLHRELPVPFGFGDGGGGPTREMLENIEVIKSFPGLPQTRCGTMKEFFDNLKADSNKLPTWNSELYLEYHRGTYTTQARNKRANRKSEFALHDAEFLAALASSLDPGHEYPTEQFNRAWELVCLNQFHDIIPGSSIAEVYTESLAQYDEVLDIVKTARERALAQLQSHTGGDVLLANCTSFENDGLAHWHGRLADDEQLVKSDGTPVPSQNTAAGTLINVGEMSPYSLLPLKVEKTSPADAKNKLIAEPSRLENDFIRIRLNPAGDITEIYDKRTDRHILPEGSLANQFQAFEDRPNSWDAWDIDGFFEDKLYRANPAENIEVIEAGPLRAALQIKRSILNSTYTQIISIEAHRAAIRFDTVIDWHEKQTLLKAAFPIHILTPEATCEIQFGNIKRPTHRNTPWDKARFEIPAQKWVDLSEHDYGVSLLNDCKYGYDVKEGLIRISLLRGTTAPDPDADQGTHHFTYTLLPHLGDWTQETARAAYQLNDPIVAWSQSKDGARTATFQKEHTLQASFVSLDKSNLIIETVKQAEDGNGIIVRLYESTRSRGRAALKTTLDLAAAFQCTILEKDDKQLDCSTHEVTFEFHPYEIINLRLIPTSN